MRKFSEREKEIIRRLVDGTSGSFVYLPINAYGDIFCREKVEFVYQPTAELRFYSQQGSVRGTDDIFKVSSEIYEISYLIDYLEKEGMLRHFSIGTGLLKNDISGFNKAGLTGLSVALDPAVGVMLYNNLNYPIYVTPTLESLVKDNFRTLEEQTLDEAEKQTQLVQKQTDNAQEQARTAHRQTILSIVAICLSIIAIIVGSLTNIWVAKNIAMDVKVDSMQVEKITSEIGGIEEKIDSLKIQLYPLNQSKPNKSSKK